MSTSRLLSLIAILIFVGGVVITAQAGIAASNVVSSPKAALDQHERHPAFVNPSAALAEQARLAYRRGEWHTGNSVASPAFDVEQARVSWKASASVASTQDDAAHAMSSNKNQGTASHMLSQQTRDAIQAHWLALHGGTNRTCVLLCGGQ